jgi:hypothetical protein
MKKNTKNQGKIKRTAMAFTLADGWLFRHRLAPRILPGPTHDFVNVFHFPFKAEDTTNNTVYCLTPVAERTSAPWSLSGAEGLSNPNRSPSYFIKTDTDYTD